MEYMSVSSGVVVARILRNTRLQDTSYLGDLLEWIPEAMKLMKTKQALEKKWKDVEINFHKGQLPCGLIHITAVECGGYRLPFSNSARAYDGIETIPNPAVQPNLFVSTIDVQDQSTLTGPGNYIWKSDAEPLSTTIEQALLMAVYPYASYYTELDTINTSFCDGTVRVHYRAMPTDKDGLPLIPDNENYQQALYWYCRAMMIGAGYDDKQFSFDKCMQYFDVYMIRAINQISYPSVDEMDSRIDTLVRLIPNDSYWNNYSAMSQPERNY